MLPNQDIRISLIQADLVWEKPDANLSMFGEQIKTLAGSTDIIILPEMFNTGFTMNASLVAEAPEGPTTQWMREIAAMSGAVIMGTLIITENGNFYNRLIWMQPNGEYHTYDKRHLFGMAGEDKVFTRGNQRLVVNYKSWRICPMICYDLRFPVWARNDDAYDMLIYTANWPERRIAQWNALLTARAIENQSYCIGLNRIGVDGSGYTYSGDSSLYSPSGERLYHQTDSRAETTTHILSAAVLAETREKLPFLTDRDLFEIKY